jgi:hypothetical protein
MFSQQLNFYWLFFQGLLKTFLVVTTSKCCAVGKIIVHRIGRVHRAVGCATAPSAVQEKVKNRQEFWFHLLKAKVTAA